MTFQNIYYLSLTVVSFALLMIFLFRWHKRFDVHVTVVFTFIPVFNLSYYLIYAIHGTDAAETALKITYVGGCFLPWIMTMCIASLCGIKVSRVIRMASFTATSVLYASVLTIGHTPFFYKSLSFRRNGSFWVTVKEYGLGHSFHYALIILYLAADIALLLYAYKKRTHVSRRLLLFMFIPIPFTVIGYAINSFTIKYGIELVPLTYAVDQVAYLLIVSRMGLYNVSDMVVESMVESGDTGFITTDFKKRYLGSNETAREILPDLNALSVDGPIGKTRY